MQLRCASALFSVISTRGLRHCMPARLLLTHKHFVHMVMFLGTRTCTYNTNFFLLFFFLSWTLNIAIPVGS